MNSIMSYIGYWDWEKYLLGFTFDYNSVGYPGYPTWYKNIPRERKNGFPFPPAIFLMGNVLCITHSARRSYQYIEVIEVCFFGYLCWSGRGRDIMDCPVSVIGFDIL